MDVSVNLVESYLRLTGYFTLTEFEVQRRRDDGTFETITDVDVAAFRSPGDIHIGDPHRRRDCDVLLIDDPELRLEPECADVIIGEVKEGQAIFNPGLKDHQVLHSVLRRLEWLYASSLEQVVSELQQHGSTTTAARGGGNIRTRLVAFGRSDHNDLHVISLSHIVETMLRFFDEFEEAFRPVHFKDPAPAFLRLLRKVGFEVAKPA